MKAIHILTALLLLLVQTNFGQSIKVVPKKIVYKRTNIDPLNDTFGMKSFRIVYPQISGAKGKRIQSLLDYEKAFGFKLLDEFKTERGIKDLNFRVLYNAKNILSVRLRLYAYTFSNLHYEKFISINTKTGTLIEPKEAFINLRGLAAKCRKSQLKTIAEMKKGFSPQDYGEVFDLINFTSEELSGFTVSRKGITFHYPYRFARTAIMFEPNSDYFFSWKELKPYIKPSGLFAQFVR